MSERNCASCSDLKEYAPEFTQNGTTSAVCSSLHNNTGFNPNLKVLHENEDDLHDANDCLIGNMIDEVESYDVCDWKEFMRNFLPNLYELLKAIICGVGGLWTRMDSLCDLIELNLSMGMQIGAPLNSNNIGSKFAALGNEPPGDFGIKLLLREVSAKDCDNKTRTYGMYTFYISSYWKATSPLSVGDVIAKWTKEEVLTMVSESFWNTWLTSPYSNTFCYVDTKTLIGGRLFKDPDGNGVTLIVETVVGDHSATGNIQVIHNPMFNIRIK